MTIWWRLKITDQTGNASTPVLSAWTDWPINDNATNQLTDTTFNRDVCSKLRILKGFIWEQPLVAERFGLTRGSKKFLALNFYDAGKESIPGNWLSSLFHRFLIFTLLIFLLLILLLPPESASAANDATAAAALERGLLTHRLQLWISIAFLVSLFPRS